jgi:C4-dicarboxylate transporter DctM subunit
MIWLFIIMFVLFVVNVPIAWSMAIAATVYMAFGPHVPLQGMVQRMIGGIDTFPLLAIPFFILAGNLMNTGGITDRLVRLAKAMVGHITGGLAHVVVVSNMIMAGMSGSGVADAAGSGTILIPAMKKAGYSVPFSAAIVGAAGTIGPIIPPSIPFVIYGSIACVSIGRLLLGGAVPGVLMGIMLMIFVYFIARKRGYPSEKRATWKELVQAAIYAIPPLGDASHHFRRHHCRGYDAYRGSSSRCSLRLHPRILHLPGDHLDPNPEDCHRVSHRDSLYSDHYVRSPTLLLDPDL